MAAMNADDNVIDEEIDQIIRNYAEQNVIPEIDEMVDVEDDELKTTRTYIYTSCPKNETPRWHLFRDPSESYAPSDKADEVKKDKKEEGEEPVKEKRRMLKPTTLSDIETAMRTIRAAYTRDEDVPASVSQGLITLDKVLISYGRVSVMRFSSNQPTNSEIIKQTTERTSGVVSRNIPNTKNEEPKKIGHYHQFIKAMLNKLSNSSTGLKTKDSMKEAVRVWRDFKTMFPDPILMEGNIEAFTDRHVRTLEQKLSQN